jgi:ribokinase
MIKKLLLDTNSYILVVGSSNTDMVIQAEHLPEPGETIIGKGFFMNPGGKGANQAVASSRLGGDVVFICKCGNDIYGKQSVELFNDEGIDTSYMLVDPKHPSGVAMITVDRNAENCIVVESGANATLCVRDLQKLQHVIENASIVLMQLEIPIETVEFVAESAHKKGVKVILNPAPARLLSSSLLSNISILTPNKTEAEMLSGVKVKDMATAEEAARKIQQKGVDTVIITLGGDGAVILNNDGVFTGVPGVVVNAIDTTAAGDVFNAALAVALLQQKSVTEAVKYACKAAAVSVTRSGAQSSAPYKKEFYESF